MKNKILNILKTRPLIIDGAMGTQLQSIEIKPEFWLDENNVAQEGCNELLNTTAAEILEQIHEAYAIAKIVGAYLHPKAFLEDNDDDHYPVCIKNAVLD